MAAILDLPSVRRLTADMKLRRTQCEDAEGRTCSNLDASISCYARLCQEWRGYLREWGQAVFKGQCAFDPTSETLLKAETQELLERAKQLAALGRATNGNRVQMAELDALHWHIADFTYRLENWVSPGLAVSPSPRVSIPDSVDQLIRDRLEKLPPLPSDWRPTDPEQVAVFNQRAK